MNTARGLTKSYGERILGCNPRNLDAEKAQALSPELQAALSPLLQALEGLTEQIAGYKRQIGEIGKQRYRQTALLKQVKGVGTRVDVRPGRRWRLDPRAYNRAMCGRYRLSRRAEIFASYFYAEYEGMDWDARYNIAPTQSVPVIRQDAKDLVRRASLMRWGLVPSWAKDAASGAGMINARSETAAEKPAFKELLQRRRCLIPADGFYEWSKTGKSKQPFCFEMIEREPFAFAGLWDSWQTPEGTALETCTILTTTPNRLLTDVHDRMPVIGN